MPILTYLNFPAATVDLNEEYKNSFRKKTVTIRAYNDDDEDDHEAGKITYSIFDFEYVPFYIDDALGESESEDWGESKFFEWVLTHKKQLEDRFLFLDKFIFFQELDLNINLINEENLSLLIDHIREEHNIHVSFAAPDTFYANPAANIKNLFLKLSWLKLTNKYYFKA